MNSPEWLVGFTAFTVVKWFLVLGLIMYAAFAVVIVRQVGVMSEAVDDPNNALIKLFAWAHFLMTILLIIVAVMVL